MVEVQHEVYFDRTSGLPMGSFRNLLSAQTILLASAFTGSALAQEPQIKIAHAGQNITVWDGWNVSATIFLTVDGGDGADCINLWWITMGINSEPWQICDTTEIEVSLPLIYGELRAGGFTRQTAIAVSDIAGVAYSAQLCDRVIEC
jgi:hypothetical protein